MDGGGEYGAAGWCAEGEGGGRDGAPRRPARLVDSAATSPQSGCCRCVE